MSAKPSLPPNAGFTLIELMVVLAILVLTTAIIPLSISRMLPGRRVAVAVERIGSAIHYAQATSRVQGRPIEIEVQEHALMLSAQGEAQSSIASMSTILSSSTQVSAASNDGRKIHRLVVYPDGATSGGEIDIVDGIHHDSVSISMLTGRVTSMRSLKQ